MKGKHLFKWEDGAKEARGKLLEELEKAAERVYREKKVEEWGTLAQIEGRILQIGVWGVSVEEVSFVKTRQ